MANSPDRDILPQETSTPLKKGVKCNAFSTPKTSSSSTDGQQFVEDFKLFLDELGIKDTDHVLDDAADCTLEDELSKLETTLKNIELEFSIQENVCDSGKDLDDAKCKNDLIDSTLVLTVTQKPRDVADIVTEGEILVKTANGKLEDDASNNHSGDELQKCENKSEENMKQSVCNSEPNKSQSCLSECNNEGSDVGFVTLDASGEISREVCNKVLVNGAPNNDNSVQGLPQGKHFCEESVKQPECTDNLSGPQVQPPISPEIITLDESSEIVSNSNLVNHDDSVEIIFEDIKNSNQNNAAALNKCFSEVKSSCTLNLTKDQNVSSKEIDEGISLKSKIVSHSTPTSEDDTASEGVNRAVTNASITCVKHNFSSTEMGDEISVAPEINCSDLKTKELCLTLAKVNDTQSTVFEVQTFDANAMQLTGEVIQNPQKCLNDIKEEKIVISVPKTHKDNIPDKPQANEKPQTDNEPITKKDGVRVAEEFISQDPEENKDNNNEKWEELRKLTTNPERYRALRKRWQNISNPDPNKNLTTRCCFRKNFIRKKLTAKLVSKIHRTEQANSDVVDNELIRKLRKRKCAGGVDDEPDAKRTKTYPCTILYDEQIAVVTKAMHEELVNVDVAQQAALSKLSFLQNLEQENLRFREGYFYRLSRNAEHLRNRQDTETLVAMEHFQKEKKKIEDVRQAELSKLKAAANEIYAFHSFYNGITEDNVNTLLLTEEQVLHLRDIENYYGKINMIYENNNV